MSITKFDISIFNGQNDLSHLNFKNNFSINFNENSIIFAFNGICKTSIAKFLEKHYADQFFVINYDGNKDKIKAVKENKKIEILPDVYSLQQAKIDYETAKQNLDLFGRIERGFGVQKSKITNSCPNYIVSAKSNETISRITLTHTEYDEIDKTLNQVKNSFGSHLNEIYDGTHNINQEISSMQQGIVKKFCEDYLNHLQVGEDSNECPICGSNLSTGLRTTLQNKITSLSNILTPYFSDFFVRNTAADNSAFLTDLSALISKYSKEKFCEYLLVDNFSEVATINSLISIQAKKKTIVTAEEARISTFLSSLRNAEPFFIDVFKNKLKFKDVKYDSNKQGLVLTTPDDRPAESYSQGELNLITLLIRLTIARSTDKPNIIIDDPLSSYDLPNQYRIVYEIVKYIRENTGKHVTLFTHNVDAINIANQYNYGCNFKYYYVEKYNNELSIEQLSVSTNVIDIDDIINHYDSEGFLVANRDRENPLFIATSSISINDLHKLFHYDDSNSALVYKGKTLTNMALYNKIDAFNTSNISPITFISNTVTKITYLMAARVFVEKKFADINTTVMNALKGKMFGEKLRIVQDVYLTDAKTKYTHLDINELKRMKVMLNQNEHYKSQVQPYYYAMNISLDELINEIQKIKQLFS